MLRSFRASLPLILVIMTAGSDGQLDWGVTYSSSSVCALKGSTVKIFCTVKYPYYRNLRSVYWTKIPYGETPDLCSDSKTGRVQCVRADRDTSSITLTAVTEADKHIYYCRFTTDVEGGKWTGTPGVQLDVTDLQVETQQTVVEGDSVTLSCKSSCSLPEETIIYWYRNTERLTGETLNNQLHLRSVTYNDTGDYRCAARGKAGELLKSPPVYLNVKWAHRSALLTLTGAVVGCEGLIFIFIIIVIICLKRRRAAGSEAVKQNQSVGSRAPDDETYTALELQSRSSEYETLHVAGASADPH
ncbi:neural cell adhesion molecule 1-like [Danio rerio]|uniref:Neural cell adhesion molecule 1-like n=2 Tax=Danio rerio TaxID=7955 RepID=A0AC58G162_DANRE